jgi:hypothetical protein
MIGYGWQFVRKQQEDHVDLVGSVDDIPDLECTLGRQLSQVGSPSSVTSTLRLSKWMHFERSRKDHPLLGA